MHNSSLLFNLRHSPYLRVFYPHKDLPKFPVNYSAAYLVALLIPDLLGHELPLVVVEDDIVFAPDFVSRLTKAIIEVESDMHRRNYKRPYSFAINLYYPNGSVNTLNNLLPHYESIIDSRSNHYRLNRGAGVFGFGSQGLLYSVAMRHDMAQFFFLAAKRLVPFSETFSDMYIHDYLNKVGNCSQKETNNPCESYSIHPSLVEHIGSMSSWNSDRMHLSMDFPVRVRFPGRDQDGLWKRRRRIRATQ